MIRDLPATLDSEKQHLVEVFANANGFSVIDHHQIFHPSTQLRPAIDPAETHWREETSASPSRKTNAFPENRYVKRPHKPCQTGLECLGSDSGCDVCILYDEMPARFCHPGDF
jgi:hypothetical protein